MENAANINVTMPMFSVSIEARQIDTMALRFMKSAIASKKAYQTINGNSENENILREMYASSCLMLLAAALEAFINEIYLDRAGNVWNELSNNSSKPPDHQFYRGCAHPKFRSYQHGKKGSQGIDQLSPVNKYKFCAEILNVQDSIDTENFADLELIFDIRNALMHFSPSYGEHRMARRNKYKLIELIGERFNVGGGDPLTRGCLQLPCLNWTSATTVKLINNFCSYFRVSQLKSGLFSKLGSDHVN
ncbi:hypothetical protein [Arsukibacterium sp.]|uniref:hypothetical protein n=1 Tax=Arsukibacterium sp. TaxID=1977258 RepID=UPI001BD2F9FD|nr:hypothetical protein [Arsukibacterium sp.]